MFTSFDKALAALLGGFSFFVPELFGFEIPFAYGWEAGIAASLSGFLVWLVPNKES